LRETLVHAKAAEVAQRTMPRPSPSLSLEVSAFARSVALRLTALSLLGAVRWLTLPVAAYVIPTRVPVLLPLLVGASGSRRRPQVA
jgi:hypothetical protein